GDWSSDVCSSDLEGAGGLDPRVCLKRTENADFAGESRDRGRLRRLSLVYGRLVKRIRAAPAPVSRGRQGGESRAAKRSATETLQCGRRFTLCFSPGSWLAAAIPRRSPAARARR